MSQEKNLKSFEELSQHFKDLHLEVPEIDEEILLDPSRLDEVVEKKMRGVAQIQKSVKDALQWLASVPAWLALCTDPMRRRIAKNEVAPNQKKVQDYVEGCLDSKEPIYRTAAAISYLNFQFSQEFTDHEEAAEMLKDLEQKGLLVRKSNGPIMIGYNRYEVSARFGLESEDLLQVQNAVQNFARGFMELVRQQRKEKTAEIKQDVNLTFEEFLEGKTQGKFLLEKIPAETYLQNGEAKWRGGGNFLLEVRGKEVLSVSGVGAIEKTVEQFVELDVRLPHYTLEWETPPGSGKDAFHRVKNGVMKTRNLGPDEAETYVRKMQAMWHIVTRGIDAKLQEKEMVALKEEYSERATVTPVQFFGLNGSVSEEQTGVVFLEFEDAFKTGSKVICNIFFLGERVRDNSGVNYFEVLDAPPHVREFLGNLSFQSNEEGDSFFKLPPNLNKVLRAIRGKTDLHSELAKESA